MPKENGATGSLSLSIQGNRAFSVDEIKQQMRRQAEIAIETADVIVFNGRR